MWGKAVCANSHRVMMNLTFDVYHILQFHIPGFSAKTCQLLGSHFHHNPNSSSICCTDKFSFCILKPTLIISESAVAFLTGVIHPFTVHWLTHLSKLTMLDPFYHQDYHAGFLSHILSPKQCWAHSQTMCHTWGTFSCSHSSAVTNHACAFRKCDFTTLSLASPPTSKRLGHYTQQNTLYMTMFLQLINNAKRRHMNRATIIFLCEWH